MPKRRHLLTAHLALGFLVGMGLAPAAHAWEVVFAGSGPTVKGSGRLVDQTRQVAAFTRLLVDGPFDVQALQGGTVSVRVRADDNLQALILTQVEGDTLVIKAQPGTSFSARQALLVTLGFSTLQSAELRGSGDLGIPGLKADRFELRLTGSGDVRMSHLELGQLDARLAGSGDITAQGRSHDTVVELAGSGDVRASDLLSLRTRVSVAGSGDAQVHASESLTARVAGSGSIRYAGRPAKLNKQVTGSGEISALR
jgi:hypothetical protein